MIKSLSVKTVLLLLLLSAGNHAFAQTNLQKAWKAFFDNKRDDARTLFNQSLSQPETSGDALLGLSLLAQLDRPSAESFGYFQKFCAQSKNPQPYIYALWITPSINDGAKKSAGQLNFLRGLTQNHNYDGTIPAMAYAILGKHYETNKQYEKADAEYKNIGSIDNWLITGEFDNISTSGFDRNYDVLNHPEADATFISKHNDKITWHEIPALRHDKWVDFEYYDNADNSIVFAQSFVKVDEPTNAQLRIGVSGSVKVWVNDQLVLTEPEERNNDLDAYIQTIKLNKGYNRVLVQSGESYAGRLNFLVRITDKNGYILPQLSAVSQPQPYTKETAFVSQKIETPAVTYFEDEIKKSPDNYLPKILLAQTYLRDDKTFEARHVIEDMRKKYPDNTFLNTMLLQVFNKEGNRTGAETIKELIKNTDPQSSEALILKYNELFGQKAFDKAADVLKTLEVNHPEQQEFVYMSKIGLASSNKNQDEIVKLAEEAYPKYPDNKGFVDLKFAIEKQLRKNNSAAIGVLKKYTADNDNYSATKELSDVYFTTGDPNSGIKTLQEEIKNKPYATGIYATLGNQYYNQQQYAKAEECYLNCVRIAPTISSYYASLGKINEMVNQKDKAINYYRKGLAINPNDYESIKSLRKLENKKDVFSYFTEPDIDALIKNAPKASDYPDDNSVILNEEVQKVVYEQGGSEERKYLTVKILTQKGIDSWKEYAIDYDSWQDLIFETAEVIKANGSKVPAERNENSLVFTNLEVGDVVNIRYKLNNYAKAKLSGYFWDSFYFSHGKPYVTSKYSLLISKNQKFSSKFTQKAIEPVKTSQDEFDMYVWQNNKQESIQYEDKMPPVDDVANILYLTSIPDWKFIQNWYNDIGTGKARTNYEVKEVIGDLFKGKASLTPMQKVEKIYNYITGNISYSSVSFRQSGIIPQNPSDVINTRIGDCKDVSTLFVAMCKEAGIKANLVLVKTRDNGMLGLPLPGIDFNHCMAKVNLNNQDYYMELTSQYLPFRSLYNAEINSTVLDIGDDKGVAAPKYLNPATRYGNNVKRNTNISFNDKSMVITEKTYETGALAASLRERYGELSQKDRIKKIKEAIAGSYPDVDVTKVDYKNIDRKNVVDTVYVDLGYQLNNVTKSIGGMSIFNLPWSSKIDAKDLQITLPRASGIDLSQLFYLDNETESITVNLPAGKKMIESLVPVTLQNDIIAYNITPKQVGNKLTFTRTFKLKKDFVPADKVPEFNAFFKQMVESDNKELAMK